LRLNAGTLARPSIEDPYVEEGWERPPHAELSLEELERMVQPAFPGASISEHAVIASGLANTNIRFRLRERESAYVLRLHTREPKAAAREQQLMSYLGGNPQACIPVAPLVYSDPAPRLGKYPYSIWGFVEGTLLQELFKTLSDSELVDIAAACGRVAAVFATHRFPTCGEFGANLSIIQAYGAPSRFVPDVVHKFLYGGRAGERLGVRLRDALWTVVERTAPLLKEVDGQYTLVHGDYKRSNILLKRSAMTWKVTGVLDWEFAFAGPPIIDVGLFLRAGEALPAGFRDAFAAGYRDAGGVLPAEWLRLSRLVDLVSQVTFLNDPRDLPRVFAETSDVVEETVRMLT
jgi:aminoglycoside phosphotransferase (APT) family kinase protein